VTTKAPGGRIEKIRIVGVVLLVLYLGFAAAVILSPQRVDGDSLGVFRVLYYGYGHGLPRWITYDLVQFVANVVLTAPIGFFLAMALPRRLWWAAALICIVLFAAGEIAQLFLPSRVPSLLDWLANSLGGFVGALLWRVTGGRDRGRRMY
jgi:hypothetical protein